MAQPILEALPRNTAKSVVLFYRDYTCFAGGHLKVRHYFEHLLSSEGFLPRIYFTPDSDPDLNQLWSPYKPLVAERYDPQSADILFLGGVDWAAVPMDCLSGNKRIINIIQGIKHADPGDIRYSYLKNKAVRICVSEEVTDALRGTGIVNGPIFTVPNGCDVLSDTDAGILDVARDIPLLIAGLKNPTLAKWLQEQLGFAGIRVHCLTTAIEREDFLALLRRAEIGVLLPQVTEGFFLPAMESMAAGALVICPDCVGNRTFCLDGRNCLRPSYKPEALLEAVKQALSMTLQAKRHMRLQAWITANTYTLERERRMLLDIMSNLAYML